MHHKQIELWGITLTSGHIKSKHHSFPLNVRFILFIPSFRQENDRVGPESQQNSLKDRLEELLFPWDRDGYQQAVRAVPPGWTVCQFSVSDSPHGRRLMLTRLSSDQEPITVLLPSFSDHKVKEMKKILLQINFMSFHIIQRY